LILLLAVKYLMQCTPWNCQGINLSIHNSDDVKTLISESIFNNVSNL